jgi:type II secretory pathway component PulF
VTFNRHKERDILNDHEIRVQRLEDRIRRVFFVNIILCIVVSVLLVVFIATTVVPEVVRWYNGLSDYNRGVIDGIVVGAIDGILILIILAIIW